MSRQALTLLAAGVLIAACASAPSVGPLVSAPPAPGATTNVAPTTAHTSAPKSADVNMCALVSLGDVQAHSPFQTPLATAESTTAIGGCQFRSEIGADQPVSVLLVVTTYDSAADAQAALANYRQTVANSDNTPLSDISGLGDVAFTAGSDEVGVHTVVGARQIDANLKGEWPDTTDAAKVASGTDLARLVISRLP